MQWAHARLSCKKFQLTVDQLHLLGREEFIRTMGPFEHFAQQLAGLHESLQEFAQDSACHMGCSRLITAEGVIYTY